MKKIEKEETTKNATIYSVHFGMINGL